MVHKVNDVKEIAYLPNVLLKILKKDIIIKERRSRIKSEKITSQKKHPRNIRIIWFFWRNYRGCENSIFPWKSIWTDIFWVWRNIFWRLFSRCYFFLDQGESTPGKKLAETQSMKTQVNSGEMPVRMDVGKIMQSVGSHRLTPKSAKLICYPILKIQSY